MPPKKTPKNKPKQRFKKQMIGAQTNKSKWRPKCVRYLRLCLPKRDGYR